MDLCLAVEWIPRPRVSRRWWEQEGVDVDSMRTASREV